MSDSDDTVTVPSEAAAVARRYHRLERPLSGLLALLSVGLFLAAVAVAGLAAGLLVGVALVVVLRVPSFRTGGTTRLATDLDPETVVDAFEGPTPPPLALQWGVADDVVRTDDGGTYDFSDLFGLRSTRMETHTRRRSAPAADSVVDLTLDVTAGGRPWGTYDVTIRESDAEGAGDATTLADVGWESPRRFGLRRLPQWYVGERYRSDALSAQGYAVVDRDAGLSL